MLKCSNLIKNQLKYALARSLFHYQNDVYINKEPILLTSNNNLNELKSEIEKSNENIIERTESVSIHKSISSVWFQDK